MDTVLTPEQKKQLDSWAAQRDAILSDIGIKKTESEGLTKKNRDLAESNTELSDKIEQAKGRLDQLDEQEAARVGLITVENAELTGQKSVLQTEAFNLRSEISYLREVKKGLDEDIESSTKIHEVVLKNITGLENKIVDIIRICTANLNNLSSVIGPLEEKCKEIIGLSTANIEGHTRVLTEIPKLFVELKRQSVERTIIPKHKSHE